MNEYDMQAYRAPEPADPAPKAGKRDRLLVTVTAKDIERGRPRACSACPVARAIARAVLPELRPIVRPSLLYLRDDERGLVVAELPLPSHVGAWMSDFDAGRPCRPMIFFLDLPEYLRA